MQLQSRTVRRHLVALRQFEFVGFGGSLQGSIGGRVACGIQFRTQNHKCVRLRVDG